MLLELRSFNVAAGCDEAESLPCKRGAFHAGDGGASQPWETKCEGSAVQPIRVCLDFPFTCFPLPASPVLFSQFKMLFF